MEDSGTAETGPSSTARRFGVYLGSGEGQQDFPRFVRLVHRSHPRRPRRHGRIHPAGDQGTAPDPRGRAGAGHAVGAPGQHVRRPGAQRQLPDRLRRQLAGDRRGVELIRRGNADVILSGGTHSMIHPFGVTGFILLTALSTRNDEPTRASRPFDRDRDGFILGEGRGHAGARGAGARQGTRRADSRRDRRLRLDGRRLPDHRQPRRRPRRDRLHAARPWPMPGSIPTTSTTSTPTAPARRSTTRSRRWRSSAPSATRPTRCRSPAPRA